MAKRHIFLSYCRDNQKDVARLREDLIKAGESVWWDQDIPPGQNWEFAIEQAIQQSYAFVLCLSKEAEARPHTGIYPEIDQAIERYRNYAPGGVFIIPVRLSECDLPPVKISATERLDKLQRVDLFPPAQRRAGLQKLLQGIRSAPGHP